MKRTKTRRQRPAVQVTLGRAARLHRLIMLLAQESRRRDEILRELGIGLRTFYRELQLVKRYGIKVQQKNRAYTLLTTARQAEGRLPFPDPQFSFAEMAELSRCPGAAGQRLAEMLARVIQHPEPPPPPQGRKRRSRRKLAQPQQGN